MTTVVIRFNPQESLFLRVHPQVGHDLMQLLWDNLDAKYPGQWRSCFKSGPVAIRTWKEVWAESFEREKLAPQHIKAGLVNVTKVCPDFPPNEAQFIRACRLAAVLDPEAAFVEAVAQIGLREEGRDEWSHPAIYWAAAKIGSFDIRNASWTTIKSRWTAMLKSELEKSEIEPVPPFRTRLSPPGKTSASRAEIRRRLADLMSILDSPRKA